MPSAEMHAKPSKAKPGKRPGNRIPAGFQRKIGEALDAGLNFFEGGDRNPVLFLTTKAGAQASKLEKIAASKMQGRTPARSQRA